MPTLKSDELLGVPRNGRRSTLISNVWRAIREEGESGPPKRGGSSAGAADTAFRLFAASDRATREQAYRLAYSVYSAQGLAQEHPREWVVRPFDTNKETFTVLAEDLQGRPVGTISLYFDSPRGLPCENGYRQELESLRRQGRYAAEVTRLATADSHRHSRELLVALFNAISVYARRVAGADDFLIEVHPRHAEFYARLLSFERLGGECACAHAQGAPAVLLRLDLGLQAELVRQIGGGRAGSERGPVRSLYSRFVAFDQEAELVRTLGGGHRPITDEERVYFGLEEAAGLLRGEERTSQPLRAASAEMGSGSEQDQLACVTGTRSGPLQDAVRERVRLARRA